MFLIGGVDICSLGQFDLKVLLHISDLLLNAVNTLNVSCSKVDLFDVNWGRAQTLVCGEHQITIWREMEVESEADIRLFTVFGHILDSTDMEGY